MGNKAYVKQALQFSRNKLVKLMQNDGFAAAIDLIQDIVRKHAPGAFVSVRYAPHTGFVVMIQQYGESAEFVI